ncbi:MAG: bifunctional DNA-formamidopyrimidine glycosylase/DNA-(apurinic or apyrimidinic site) lyase [Planctomycetota bacterium]
MPELPEVETVRRTLGAAAGGKRVVDGELTRSDVWNGPWPWARVKSAWVGRRLSEVARHGKQLGLACAADESGTSVSGTVCVHLGMSGRLCVYGPDEATPKHTHWWIDLEDGSRMAFTDPRRFGGLWGYESLSALRAKRWDALGQDALTIGPATLHRGLRGTQRALKAALLDQALVAGLGNIYVDELLFTVRLSPWAPANDVSRRDCERLVRAMRTLLGRAIEAGGTTLRDYVDADGRAGGFALKHRVYGRSGLPCTRCRAMLRSGLIAQRTTVWCDRCQAIDAEKNEVR